MGAGYISFQFCRIIRLRLHEREEGKGSSEYAWQSTKDWGGGCADGDVGVPTRWPSIPKRDEWAESLSLFALVKTGEQEDPEALNQNRSR